MEIEYHRSLTPVIRKQVKPLIRKYRFLLPSWLQSLQVRFTEETSDYQYLAFIEVDYEYRQAKLTVTTRWEDAKPSLADLTIAHEFVHVLLAPMDALGRNFVANLTDEGSREAFREEWRKAVESSTEDTARAIYERERRRSHAA